MTVNNISFARGIFIRIFRSWSTHTEKLDCPLSPMLLITKAVGLPDAVVPAAGSLLELVEGHLGRRLIRECCCSQTLTPDEQALLGLLEYAPSVDCINGSSAIPHGLPSIIAISAVTVRHYLGMPRSSKSPILSDACPFIRSRQKMASIVNGV